MREQRNPLKQRKLKNYGLWPIELVESGGAFEASNPSPTSGHVVGSF
jgi:hypothetical protein